MVPAISTVNKLRVSCHQDIFCHDLVGGCRSYLSRELRNVLSQHFAFDFFLNFYILVLHILSCCNPC